ncbi:hypothetical protein [Fulvivirga lutea]|uniref:Uncharacterized protein n=1 Tax=Fulvivirga lutea TaxID=2810512 RepID=A0A974WED0_9BACT|nr:hypothetical protein [Fulvivirga lutea]QSE96034.1 hypothetical protein JR347_10440 [Fulvivirga lutea]
MKTTNYNPSNLEVQFARAIEDLQEQIEKHLPDNDIISIENRISEDNPLVKFYLLDKDGDPHEMVIKIIQTPDKF